MLQRPLLAFSRSAFFSLRIKAGHILSRRHFARICAANPSIAAILGNGDNSDGQRVTAVGAIRTVRHQKRRSFVELGDGSTVHPLQALLEPSQAEGLGTGTSVALSGHWRLAPAGKEQSHELHVEEVRILGPVVAETYPIQKKYQSAEYLRGIPHLRLRVPVNALVARLKSECDFHLAQYFRQQGFVRVQPPIITSSDCEGAGEVFTISPNTEKRQTALGGAAEKEGEIFFRSPKFLSVSSQLHLEAFVLEHQKVWTLSPTFRAEKSDTPRHLSEFWMLEAELRTEDVADVMNQVEDMIQVMVAQLQESSLLEELISIHGSRDPCDIDDRHRSELLHERWNGLLRKPWRRIKYEAVMEQLQKAVRLGEVTFQYDPVWEHGLQLEHEKYIAAYFGQGSPVFVTDYPLHVKPFYMLPSQPARSDARGSRRTAACFDLLLPDGTEVVGGSMREHRLGELETAMQERQAVQGQDKSASSQLADQYSASSGNDLSWYLDLRRYGSVPHGGFGLGFDRLIGYLAGIANVRDVVAWPRYPGRCEG